MIEAKKIFFSYQNSFSLNNISILIKKGEILGLIGKSGSGKSTLLKILGGFIEPTKGIVLLENKPILLPSERLIKGEPGIKTVTQDNTLFPNISVFENIAYELRFFKKSYIEKRVNYLLKLLKIFEIRYKLPKELSGGEIQRTLIARALADEPKVLLLDEPFSNLDTINKRNIVKDLKNFISKENIACLFVSHDISDVLGNVDALAIINGGKLIQTGTPEFIYKKPQNKYVAELTGDGFYIKIDDSNKIFIRPENIILNDQGKNSSKIFETKFRGFYYENYINFNNQELFFRSFEKFELGSFINFDFLV
jgi:ABC-type Fe3+/spermidine/putrescine transport system ATPase subunit